MSDYTLNKGVKHERYYILSHSWRSFHLWKVTLPYLERADLITLVRMGYAFVTLYLQASGLSVNRCIIDLHPSKHSFSVNGKISDKYDKLCNVSY